LCGAVAQVGADGLAEIGEPHKVVLSAWETSSGQISPSERGVRIDARTYATAPWISDSLSRALDDASSGTSAERSSSASSTASKSLSCRLVPM